MVAEARGNLNDQYFYPVAVRLAYFAGGEEKIRRAYCGDLLQFHFPILHAQSFDLRQHFIKSEIVVAEKRSNLNEQ